MKPKTLYATQDVATAIGLSPARIRQLEAAGALTPAYMTPGNVHLYAPAAVARLAKRYAKARAIRASERASERGQPVSRTGKPRAHK